MPTTAQIPEYAPAPFTKRIVTLFDTTEDGHPSEAVLFGDDMKAVSYRTRCGLDMVSLTGPEGEIDLTRSQWAEVVAMLFPSVPLALIRGVER